MPAISRDKRDLAATGHPCTPVIPCEALGKSVFVNGSKVLRAGDPLLPHFIKKGFLCIPHPTAVVNAGSRTVFAEGRPVARLGDSADFGAMITGRTGLDLEGAYIRKKEGWCVGIELIPKRTSRRSHQP